MYTGISGMNSRIYACMIQTCVYKEANGLLSIVILIRMPSLATVLGCKIVLKFIEELCEIELNLFSH